MHSVNFNDGTNKFQVLVKDLAMNVILPEQEFDFVVNCTGHFSIPNVPYFEGFETFKGRILHSHDFRSAEEFKGLTLGYTTYCIVQSRNPGSTEILCTGQRVLVIGAHYSSEDLALQTVKFGAKRAICSYRTKPTGFKWPKGIEERPLLKKVEGRKAFFKDGTTAEVVFLQYKFT